MQKMSFLIRTVTVGSGIPVIKDTSPDQPPKRVMDYTIGRDLHPATKTSNFYILYFILYFILYYILYYIIFYILL